MVENVPQCAVVGCPERGRPQLCPYDGRYHHHGRIHYENGHPWHPAMRFYPISEEGWLFVCNQHYAEIEVASHQPVG